MGCSNMPKFFAIIDQKMLNTLVLPSSTNNKQVTVESATCGSNERTSEMKDVDEVDDYDDVEIESLDNDVPPSHGTSEIVNKVW